MSEFVLNEEPFKLGLVEKVPSPQKEECFLLCQSGAGAQNSMLINHGVRYSSAEIRHGHYNQKITLSLEEKTFSQSYRVSMEDKDFHFDVMVKMAYALQDARIYFFQGKMEEEDISHTVRNAMRQQDEKWKVGEDIKLQNALETEIEKKLEQYKGVRFRRLEVLVTPEEAAEKIRESNKKKTVGIHVSKNETDEQIARNEQAERVADSEQRLKMKQISDMALMWKNFGNMGSIVNEYLKGNMDGKELYNYIMKGQAENISMLKLASEGDMLTQKEIMEKLNEIFANNEFLLAAEQKQLSVKEEKKEENGKDAGEEEKSGEKIVDEAEHTEKEAADGEDYI